MKYKILKGYSIASKGRFYLLLVMLLLGMAHSFAQSQVYIACGESGKNLTTVSTSTPPTGAVVTWHTGTPATTANKIATPANVGAGIYYAAFFHSGNDCYSPATQVTVIKQLCIECGATSANLTALTVSAGPSNTTVTWHTGTPATTANKVSNPAAAGTGNYYAAYYHAGNDCYSPTAVPVQVIKKVCIACGASTADLTALTVSAGPAGTTVTWHTGTPATTANKVTNPAAVPAGTYYAAYYHTGNDCYSPTSGTVQVVKKVCIPCNGTLADLTALSVSAGPSGTTVTWHTGSPATTANKVANPAAVPAGTYYAAYYHAGNNCYSPTSGAVLVEATTPCSNAQPDVNVGLVNTVIPGNVSTNDNVPAGTTYGNPGAPVSSPAGSNLTITMNSNGTYTFQTDKPGVYTYNVPVCPSGQTTGCPTQPLVITVTDPTVTNNPPIANTDLASTPYNTQVTVPILANDGPGNAGGTLGAPTITGGTNAGATAMINGSGQLVYTPAPGFVGKDTIYYQVCESPSGICVTSSAIITVDPPSAVNTTVAADDYVTTTGITPATGNVKNNDSDPQGNTQTVTAQGSVGSPITIPGKGTYYINSDGTYSFTAEAGFSGTVDIPYTTCDNGTPQACTKATLHIVVKPENTTPITLHSFVAFASSCTANLSWATAAEINADRFEVEVSNGNSGAFSKVGTVPVNAISTGSYYQYQFAMQSNVQYFFRLKMIDRDGSFKYSIIRRLTCINGKQTITVAPNPVKDKFIIAGMEKGNNKVTVFNAKGQQISALTITGTQGYVDIANMPAGMYMLQIISNTGVVNHAKIIKE